MSWKRLDFNADAVARGTAAAVKAAFAGVFETAGRPRNAAMFEAAADGGLHLYFSPGAAVLFAETLKVMTTTRSGAPPADARLAAGDPETWDPESWARR